MAYDQLSVTELMNDLSMLREQIERLPDDHILKSEGLVMVDIIKKYADMVLSGEFPKTEFETVYLSLLDFVRLNENSDAFQQDVATANAIRTLLDIASKLRYVL